jgi:putative transposase
VGRPLRVSIPGALYHVVARGNARKRCFWDDKDKLLFLEALSHVCDRYGLICLAYCLLDNHYHLLAETPRANLSIGMRQLNGLYARRHNQRHERCGHVFQARFRSILVEKETHLLSACRYIVLNPVRAHICERPEQYRWSSYRATAGLAPVQPPLQPEPVLAMFTDRLREARRLYRDFVLDGINEADEPVRGERLGSASFLSQRFGYDAPIPEIPRVHIEPTPPPLASIFTSERTPVAVAYRNHGYTLRAIADYLGCHYSTVSRRLGREEATMA